MHFKTQGRLTRGEAKKLLGDARASLWELDTQVEISRRRGFVTQEVAFSLSSDIERVSRLLSGLIRFTIREQRREGTRSYADALERKSKKED